MAKRQITAQLLREHLNYDPHTGIFTWTKKTRGWNRVGEIAGFWSDKGYRYIRVSGITRAAHRLAWLYVHGRWPTEEIDHIDGDRSNNVIANLREIPKIRQVQNQRKPHKQNKVGFLGVHRTRHHRYCACISIDGKNKHLGNFATAEEAHVAYIAAKRQLHPFGTL
jgi:HNH endonuclease